MAILILTVSFGFCACQTNKNQTSLWKSKESIKIQESEKENEELKNLEDSIEINIQEVENLLNEIEN